MMKRMVIRITLGSIMVFGILNGAPLSDAHPWRPAQIPNGSAFDCATCHMSAFGGDARNPFGRDVEARVSPGSTAEFWGPALAMLDSDGDGAANGVELGDPEGAWRPGDPNPQVAQVFNPGDPNSTPPLQSEPVAYTAILLGAKENPPITTRAHGWMIARLSADESTLDYWLHVFEIDNVTDSHIHLGAADENGGIVHHLEIPREGPTSGSISVTQEGIQVLNDGRWYVNVHSQEYPGGEIRGQLEVMPLRFVASLDGDQEVPPVATDGSGEAVVEISPDLSAISWSVAVSDLEGITMAHFHRAPVGENGGVLIWIADSEFSETTGEAELTEDFLFALLNKEIYINVHTVSFGGGEIRGQVYWDVDLNLPTLSSMETWEMMR